MKLSICCVAMLLLASSAMAQAAPKEPTPEEHLAQARNNAAGNPVLAQKECEAVLADAKATEPNKIDAFTILASIPRAKKDAPAALAVAGRMAKDLAASTEAVKAAFLLQDDIFWEASKRDDSIAKLKEFVAAYPQRKADCAAVESRMAFRYWNMQKYKECYDEAAKAIDLDPANDKQVAQSLVFMQDASCALNELDKCLAALGRLMEPKYMSTRGVWEPPGYHWRYADCLVRLKRPDEATAHLAAYAAQATDPRLKQETFVHCADIFAPQGKFDQALGTLERVFTEGPPALDWWYLGQRRIAGIYQAQKRWPEALSALRVCLDAAADLGAMQDCTAAIAECLRELDKGNVTRANQFIEFMQFGPNGKDGKQNVPNPLAGVAYPSYPGREQAQAQYRPKAGDSVNASVMRGLGFTYCGKPGEAIKYYADAFRRAAVAADVKQAGTFLIEIGAKAMQGGTPAGLDKFYAFLKFGPAGPDGKPGTPDDLQDPFAPLGVAAQAPVGDGGLAELTAEQKKDLAELIAGLESLCEPGQTWNIRVQMAMCLNRAHTALCDWGAKGQKEWYTRVLLSTPEDQVRAQLAEGAAASLRAGQLHFGAVREFVAALDAAGRADGFGVPTGHFQVILNQFNAPQNLRPVALKPYPVPTPTPAPPAAK